jgi:PPOX class probable F420-dependent enzyme
MASLTPEQARLFAGPNHAALTTLRRDGSPQTTVVWVELDGDELSFNTAAGRAKERHLRRDPRLSLMVVDPDDPYRWVAVNGTGELTAEDADDQIDRLAKKYLGEDRYPYRRADEVRLKVRVRPEKVDSYGFDGQG